MDTVYSLSLLISLISGALGAAFFALTAVRLQQVQKLGPRVALVPMVCGSVTILFGMVSLIVHMLFGHGSDSVAPMATLQFFWHHKAYWIVLFFIVLAYWGWRSASRYEDKSCHGN
jgi:phosphotransferase system  glucose/maltose/N-acetylglucosamine-specific IIC component